jgi:hypothetical protein
LENTSSTAALRTFQDRNHRIYGTLIFTTHDSITTSTPESASGFLLYILDQPSLPVCHHQSKEFFQHADSISLLGLAHDTSHGRIIYPPKLCHIDLPYERLKTICLSFLVHHIYRALKDAALIIPPSGCAID